MRHDLTRVSCVAWTLLLCALFQPVVGRPQEASSEILNFPEAPFELLPGPDGETSPNWGGILSLSFFVRNISPTTLYQVTVRLEQFDAAATLPEGLRGWHVHGIELGRPDGLGPGEKAQVLYTLAWGFCSPFNRGRGSARFILMPEAAEGFRSFAWRRRDSQPRRPIPLEPGSRPGLIARTRIDPRDRPAGASGCAGLRQQAVAECATGLESFECIARPQGVPQVVEHRCAQFDVVRRWARLRQDPNWCRKGE